MASLALVVFVVAIAVAVAVVAAAVAEEMLVLVSTPPLAVLSLSPSPNLSFDVVDAVAATKARGGRIIAVGTTSVRSLESAAQDALKNGTQQLK